MSYIFNNFSSGEEGGPSFSSVVAIAREKGYTVQSFLLFPTFSYQLILYRNLTQQMILQDQMSPVNWPSWLDLFLP